jgi:ankyrin repeat protein
MWASKEGNEDIVKLLLAQKNIQVNSTAEQGLTALMMAVISGNTAVLKAILEHKDLDANAKCQDTEVLEGASTLGLIAGKGAEDMARLMLEHPDIDPELPDMWGRTPLARAAIQGHVGMVKLLLERNDVSVNSFDANGDTPLIHAAEEGEKLVVQELLNQVQIQVAAINDDGQTALTAAAFQGHECIVQMLLDPNRGYDKKDINQALDAAQREAHKDIQRFLAMQLEVLG